MRERLNRVGLGLLLLASVGSGVASAQKPGANEPVLTLTAHVDLGADRGQNFGSLFEIKDATGRVVAGGGFPAIYNTRFRMDRQTLQFYARPQQTSDDFTFQRLPKPDENCGLYMFDEAGRLFAINETASRHFWELNPQHDGWQPATGDVDGMTSSNDGVTRLGDGVLRFAQGTVTYKGRTVLPAPAEGSYANFYYAMGRLFFYHTVRSETGGYTRICACRWTPDDEQPIDVAQSDAIPVEPVGATTWAYGHLGEKVLTVSNHGGVFVHDGEKWSVVRERVPNVSYQVYSVVTYYDRLLLGHYPTGEIFEFDGTTLTNKQGSPPRLPEVSPSARECQTLALYRGELFAGVWPWGEVWRHDFDADQWQSLGRLFAHPEAHSRTVHPYEADALRHELVLNQFGQRVTSAVNIGPSLMFSTSAKSNLTWDDKFADFLTGDAREEYGAVMQLTIPGNVSAPMTWKSGPTELQFVIDSKRMTVLQDGTEIGATDLPDGFVETFRPAKISWGDGLFGALNGSLTAKSVAGSAAPESP